MVRGPHPIPPPAGKVGGGGAPPGASPSPPPQQEIDREGHSCSRDIIYKWRESWDAKQIVQPKLLAEPTPGKKSMSLKDSDRNILKGIDMLLLYIYIFSFALFIAFYFVISF